MDRRNFTRRFLAGLVAAGWHPAFSRLPAARPRPKVIVVGAGVAGAAAANALVRAGLEVTVLEAAGRVGGRIHTFRDWGVPLELGANWVHYADDPANPVGGLLQQLGVAVGQTDYSSFRLFDPAGRKIGRLRAALFAWKLEARLQKQGPGAQEADYSLRELIDRLYRPETLSPTRRALLDFAETAHANSLGADLDDVSAAYYLQTEEWGNDSLVLGGYDRLVKHLLEGVPVRLNAEVAEIRRENGRVGVHTPAGLYEADFVLLTVPVSILRAGKIKFYPELPAEKTAAFSRIRLGLFNKVMMRFAGKFWDGNPEFLILQQSQWKNGGLLLNYHPYGDQPILVAMPVGEAARWVEAQAEETVARVWREALHRAYPRREIELEALKVTRWQANPFSMGAYSHVPVGSSARDFEALAQPVGPIHFAGEATVAEHHATVHGAYLSGLREARRILAAAGWADH